MPSGRSRPSTFGAGGFLLVFACHIAPWRDDDIIVWFIFELNNFTDYCLPYSYQHSTWDACHVAGLAVVLVITGVFIQDMRRSVRDRSMSASSVHGMLGSQETMKVAQTDNNIMLYLGSCSLAARLPCEPKNMQCFPGFTHGPIGSFKSHFPRVRNIATHFIWYFDSCFQVQIANNYSKSNGGSLPTSDTQAATREVQ